MNSVGHRTAVRTSFSETTGLSENVIEQLVRSFYERVRSDPLIGPVFAERIADWEPHLQRMCAFWSSVALMTGRYHGRPMEKHAPLPIEARHFDRWLKLFRDTATDVCSPAAAAHVVQRAEWIARSLEFGIAAHRGVRLADGERLPPPMPRVAPAPSHSAMDVDDGQ